MRLLLVSLFICFIAPVCALAQSSSPRPTSEQSLQELVSEVRQLRATLQRLNSSMYKGQVALERFRLQQEQVNRLSRELVDVREAINEIRTHQARLKELILKVEAGVESGVKHPAELASLKAELEELKDREPRLTARESQLSNDLELERAKLNDLNDRLNALEQELGPNKP